MSRVSKNIAFNLTGQALTVALGFIGTRLVFRQLGGEALGILYFALAIYAVLVSILDLGVSSTIIREVAAHYERDLPYLVRLIRTTTSFYWLSYGILAVGIWRGAPWLVSRWITLKSLEVPVAIQALRILALSLLLMLPRSLYANMLRGIERMEFNNFVDVGTTALHQAGTVLVLLLGKGLVQIAYCYLGALLLSNVAYIAIVTGFFPVRALLPGFFPDVARKNVHFMSHLIAYSFLTVIQMESDKALVSRFLPVASLGFYGVAQTLVARVSRIPGAVNQAAFPRFSALFHQGDRLRLISEYRRLQDLVCYGLVPIFAGIIFASKPLFTYLLSVSAAQVLVLPTALLCLGWYMNGTLNVPFVFSLAVGRADISSKQNFYALFLVLPVTAFLIWKWGLTGAGLSFVAFNIYSYGYGARRTASECLEMSPLSWYEHVFKILALALLTYGGAWLGLSFLGTHSIPALALAYFLASVPYVWVGYLAIGQELRDAVIGWRTRFSGGVLRYITQ